MSRDALVSHPSIGSEWLKDARIEDGFVIGLAWDDGEAGSVFMPDDYRGEWVPVAYPATCVRKWADTTGEEA